MCYYMFFFSYMINFKFHLLHVFSFLLFSALSMIVVLLLTPCSTFFSDYFSELFAYRGITVETSVIYWCLKWVLEHVFLITVCMSSFIFFLLPWFNIVGVNFYLCFFPKVVFGSIQYSIKVKIFPHYNIIRN